MVIKIIASSVLLTILSIGIFLVFGVIYNFIENKNNQYLYYTFGSRGILFTGIIGTTIHELSHYIMCKIFAHRVIDMKLFTPEKFKEDGTLGFVRHTYNRKNIYQNIGNFFIGIAPMLFGTIFLGLCLNILLPEIYSELSMYISELMKYALQYKIYKIFLVIKSILMLFLGMFLSTDNLLDIRFWIFIFIMCSISSHMSLSKADLKNSSTGIICIFTISIVVSFVSLVLNLNISILRDIFISYNIYLACFLSVGLIFSLLAMAISYLMYRIKRA